MWIRILLLFGRLSKLRCSGFFEFDMAILEACRGKPLSVTGICRCVGNFDSNLNVFHKRVKFLVDHGLLCQVFVGKRFLSGEPKNSVRHFVLTDAGAEVLFFYNQAKAVYPPVKKDSGVV